MRTIYVSEAAFNELSQKAAAFGIASNDGVIKLAGCFIAVEKEQMWLMSEAAPTPSIQRIIKERLFPYYIKVCEKHPKLYTLTDERMKKGVARFQECLAKTNGDYSKAERLMGAAIDALAASDFHMGRGKMGLQAKFNDWSNHLFKSTEKLEQWLEKA